MYIMEKLSLIYSVRRYPGKFHLLRTLCPFFYTMSLIISSCNYPGIPELCLANHRPCAQLPLILNIQA